MSSQVSGLAGAPASALPPINSALEPAWVRKGSASTRAAYDSALAFEQVLVEQLTSSLGESSALGGEGSANGEGSAPGSEGEGPGPQLGGGMLSSMLPQALSKGIIAGGGLGLAAQLTHELQGLQAPTEAASAGGVSAPRGAAPGGAPPSVGGAGSQPGTVPASAVSGGAGA